MAYRRVRWQWSGARKGRKAKFVIDAQEGPGADRPRGGVTKQAVWLSGIVDFGKAEEILQEIGQIAISDSSV